MYLILNTSKKLFTIYHKKNLKELFNIYKKVKLVDVSD